MMNDAAGMSDADLYRMVRGQIEFEDNLITQRLSWFVAAQSFLFTAYAINLNGPNNAGVSGEQHRLVLHLIPVVAMASCVLIYLGILAGAVAQRRLREYVKQKVASEVLASWPAVHGSMGTRIFGMAAPVGLPLVFMGVWISLFVRGMSI